MFKKKAITRALPLIAACALLLLSACSKNQNAGSGADGKAQPSDAPIGALISDTVSFDFSCGSPDTDIRTEIFHSYGESITNEDKIYELSAISGLDFEVSLVYKDERTIAEWAADSTLFAGLDGLNMKEDFTFINEDSLRWFMMDSLWRTLGSPEDLHYTMDGGEDLVFDELYPTNVFPADLPYMGSAFYFAHSGVKGDDDGVPDDFVGDISYMDNEYGLMIYYPETFAAQPENPGDVMLRFPSLADDIVLQYWVTPNVYEETPESFAEDISAEEVYCYENTVIGWMNDLDPAGGDVLPSAYYWLVEQDFIACVAIICQTEEQAEIWCGKLMVEDAVRIENI